MRLPDVAALIQRASAGDPLVQAVVQRPAALLGRALATVALLFDPAAIVVGGELAPLGHLLLGAARRELAAVPFGGPDSSWSRCW